MIGDRVVGVCWGARYCSRWARVACGGRIYADWCGPHRVPGDNATSEVIVRAQHACVHDVHAHALARQVAVVIAAVDGPHQLPPCAIWVAASFTKSAIDAVDAPGRALLHAQPAGHGFHVVVARGGGVALGQRRVRALQAVNLN